MHRYYLTHTQLLPSYACNYNNCSNPSYRKRPITF